MVNAFSFCVYGGSDKYCRGLSENLKIITRDYPTYHTYIIAGKDVPTRYISEYCSTPRTHVTLAPFTGGVLKTERFFIADLEGIDVCFIRDADSRINGRDSWCIHEFLKSDRLFHIIRDHPYHGRRIMGGMWGIKKGCLNKSITLRGLYDEWKSQPRVLDSYQSDQNFLEDMLYPLVRDRSLIHTNYRHFPDEQSNPITYPSDGTNFVGNVVLFKPNTGEPYFEFRI